MLFFSFFKTLVNHEVTVELKNDISIRGTLKSVDQYLNIKLDDITVVDELKYPHLVSTRIFLDEMGYQPWLSSNMLIETRSRAR